ncbi:putative bifunctional diguanylate cyclase/phosphodiesterase [Kaarinaea lacus]
MPQFIRNFTIVSMLGLVMVTGILGYLYREQEIGNLITLATSKNEALAQVFSNENWPEISPYYADAQVLDNRELRQHTGSRQFDKVIRTKINKLGIHRVSVLALNGKTIFSTNPRQLGVSQNTNPQYQQARQGIAASRLVHRELVTSLEEIKLDRHLVISYLPVRQPGDMKVEAVLEIHLDVTHFVQRINDNISLAYFTIVLLLILLIAVFFVLANRAETVIKNLMITISQQEKFIEHQGYHDMLTGLPNRILFRERLESAMQVCQSQELLLAVLFIDLDHFQKVNDALGHAVGDRVLLEVSGRLKACVRSGDTVARIGGDEFVLILEGITVLDEAEEVARQIVTTVSEPIVMEDKEFFITPSIGIALYPFDDDDVNSLLKKANSAMYKAKNAGRNTFRYFAESARRQLASRFSIENALRRALERDEFKLHYQPVVQAITGKILAVEALLRWQSADVGVISPMEFIPMLEETGLIIPVGQWVLEHACQQNVLWQQRGIRDLKINVNMSAKQLLHKNLMKQVNEALDNSGLRPHLLDLEITESLLIEDFSNTIQILDLLNETGISLSVDDFGTGYSSLSYLKRMPVDTLKIDQSFVRDITVNIDDAAIVEAICALSKSLRFKVTAEGVENAQQLEYLRRVGVTAVQGYMFSRPMSAEDLEPLLLRETLFDSSESVA